MPDSHRTRVVIEWGSFDVAHELIQGVVERPLLLSSAGSLRNGRAGLLCERLAAIGVQVQDVVTVATEPTVEMVDRLSAVARARGYDGVVALGGGAVIDSAKAVA